MRWLLDTEGAMSMRRNNSGNSWNDFLKINIGRRALMKSSLLGGGAAAAGALFGGLIPADALAVDPSSKYEGPIVETASGKVRGVIQSGTHTFKGIPYGASTAGSNRFMPPRKPASWRGAREATRYGAMAVQPIFRPSAPASPNQTEITELYRGLGASAPSLESEDCLVLNVWTAGLSADHHRPVM